MVTLSLNILLHLTLILVTYTMYLFTKLFTFHQNGSRNHEFLPFVVTCTKPVRQNHLNVIGRKLRYIE